MPSQTPASNKPAVACNTQARTKTGSLLGLSWSLDGTQLAACGSSGAVIFGQLVGRVLEDGRVHAALERERHITVHDIVAEIKEELDFKDPVVSMSLGGWHVTGCMVHADGIVASIGNCA